ncbi:imidazole glycerol phosphate synthase subunit HisH [Adlercreutzia sp. ZJ141]|uniref:imidazole glycerol phosphate synthase subunit HisH n=1 Tax=Adlercreutzia sp. ZJ141 TaxID=2709406 RepID=UPI0013EDE453|nr:imidazole glycerol phosphate synthase subunit HisH [Adlercreutzia sp. ZJ141]
MIAVVDYKKGNLKSVERGLVAAGADARITDNPDVIGAAHGIVLPGVGAFADTASTMESLGQMEVVRERVLAGVPFLGICLGMHLMFEEGTETHPGDTSGGAHRGLGILPGVVDAMPRVGEDGRNYKIPHVGWNSIEPVRGSDFNCELLAGVKPGEYFYFTHSYAAPATEATVAIASHSIAIPSVVRYRDVAFGVQFHPEKSSDAGTCVLRNFVRIVKEA